MSKRKQGTLSSFGFVKKSKNSEEQQDGSSADDSGQPSATTIAAPAGNAGPAVSMQQDEQAGSVELSAGESTSTGLSHPSIWSSQQWTEWKSRNPWLFTKDGKLGCSVCRDTKTLLSETIGSGTHLSEEWINGDVSSQTQLGLRKKNIQT